MISATRTPEFDKVLSQIKNKGNTLSFALEKEELTLKNVQQYMMMYQ
jgi:hypothetical protein